MGMKKCFGTRNGYLLKCHEHTERIPICDDVEKCYQKFLRKLSPVFDKCEQAAMKNIRSRQDEKHNT